MGTSTLILPILSRSTNEEGVGLQNELLYGWMTRIQTLITKILGRHSWITILMTSNGWISLDLAFDGWKVPCAPSSWRPYIGKCHMGGNKSYVKLRGAQGNLKENCKRKGPLSKRNNKRVAHSLSWRGLGICPCTSVDMFYFIFRLWWCHPFLGHYILRDLIVSYSTSHGMNAIGMKPFWVLLEFPLCAHRIFSNASGQEFGENPT